MTVDKRYINPAIIIFADLYLCRRAGITGFKTMKEFREHLQVERPSLDTKIERGAWVGDFGIADDIFQLRHKYTGETVDQMIESPILFENEHIWKSGEAYDQLVLLMHCDFLDKFKLSDKWKKKEREQLLWVQHMLLSEITCKSNHQYFRHRHFREHKVTSYADIPKSALYGSDQLDDAQEKKREESNRHFRELEEFKRTHFAMLTDHYAWRAVYLKDRFEYYKDKPPAEQVDGMRDRGLFDITDEEFEHLRRTYGS